MDITVVDPAIATLITILEEIVVVQILILEITELMVYPMCHILTNIAQPVMGQ
jgi:hypothetical protein